MKIMAIMAVIIMDAEVGGGTLMVIVVEVEEGVLVLMILGIMGTIRITTNTTIIKITGDGNKVDKVG